LADPPRRSGFYACRVLEQRVRDDRRDRVRQGLAVDGGSIE
jgi:hypothetical protein